MEQTKLTITNNSTEEILIWVTLGAVKGCIQNVQDLPFISNGSNLQGSFTLPPQKSISYTPPSGVGLNGNLAFDTPPSNCPPENFPTGVNLAEFMLNNDFQTGQPQETIDISGVAGTNALIEFSMNGGGTWNAGSTVPYVTNFKNGAIGENKGKVGVFPYGCEDCNISGTPVCPSNPPYDAPTKLTPQDEAICNVQRNAAEAGGTVTISFNGYVDAPV